MASVSGITVASSAVLLPSCDGSLRSFHQWQARACGWCEPHDSALEADLNVMLSQLLFSAKAAVASAGVSPGRPWTHPLALPPFGWSQPTASSSSRGCAGTQIRRRRLLSPAGAVLETVGAMADQHPGEAAGWPSLLMTCGLMFLGAYGCGMLPRWLPNQQRLTSTVTMTAGSQHSK